ncbi:MAG: hypothetical protein MI864_06015 [Pseudomonadales bacterium]|nr:hypothetical protein [Pseudomonadales bacterium]
MLTNSLKYHFRLLGAGSMGRLKKVTRNNSGSKTETYTAVGVALGVVAGVVLGQKMNDMGLWIAICVALGAGLGSTLDSKTSKNSGQVRPE